MTSEEAAEYYKKAYKREKEARKEAERILESKAEELYNVNKKLLYLNANLEQRLYERIEQIKEAEEQYRQVVETANDVIFQADLMGNFTYVNHTGVRISGYSPEDLIGQSFMPLVHPDFLDEVRQLYQNQLKGEIESTYIEYPIINRKGEEIWLGQNVQLVFKDGFPVSFLALARDITERVHSDMKLRKSEEKYKKMFEGAFDGVMRLDANGNLVEWNTTMQEMLGYDAGELRGMEIIDIIHPEDREKSEAYFHKLLTEGFYTNYAGRIIAKSGRVIHVEVNSMATFEDGELSGSIDNVRDITERISIEKAIIQSEEKYRGILENMELGLLEVDREDRIVKVYPSFCKLTGYDEADLLGKDPNELLLHPDSVEVIQREQEKRLKGESGVYQVQIRTSSGAYKWVIISGAPFYDGKGNFTGSIGVHLDISQQKQMEADLKAANQIAQASSKAKELFLANMSHEIRTPLNAVIGLSNLLKRTDLNREQTDYVSNINNAAKNLLLLVNDILDISKIESGKQEVNVAPFNLRKTLGTIMSSVNYLAEKKDLKLRLEIDEQLATDYIGDELKLCQVLINLTNNAVKFTSSGKVELRVNLEADLNGKHQLKIAVEDTGKGIANDALDAVFEDFAQEDNTISKEYGGTGLGLSISKKLVGLMGGDLQVASELGKGTTFYFKLTMDVVEMNPSAQKAALNVNWQKVRILTVEDNAVNQFVIESTIKSWGGHTDLANHGKEAVDMLMNEMYDVVLMDMQMPVMDGITATKIIRQELKLETPIIAFTANAIKKEKERCLAVGMNDYIAKPFQEEVLKEKIIALVLNQEENTQFLEKEPEPEEDKATFFSLDKLVELSRGNPEFVERMLTIFIEDAEAQRMAMIETDDEDEIARLAHKIKPSIDYLSDSVMKDLVRQVEERVFVENPDILHQFTSNLKQLINEAKQALANH